MRVGYDKRADCLKTIQFIAIRFALVVCILVVACNSPSTSGVDYEKRAIALDKSLMCPVCPGESLDQSQTQLAYQMKAVIRGKINDGWTDKQILDYFVERYGPSVLLEPQTEGVSLLVWIVPPVAVLFALGVMLAVLRGRVNRLSKEVDGSLDISLREEPEVAVLLDEVSNRGWAPKISGLPEERDTRNED